MEKHKSIQGKGVGNVHLHVKVAAAQKLIDAVVDLLHLLFILPLVL
jgi:hypothetical protein